MLITRQIHLRTFPAPRRLPAARRGFVTHDYLEHPSSGGASWATAQNSQALRT
jgi:hypothetical protein